MSTISQKVVVKVCTGPGLTHDTVWAGPANKRWFFQRTGPATERCFFTGPGRTGKKKISSDLVGPGPEKSGPCRPLSHTGSQQGVTVGGVISFDSRAYLAVISGTVIAQLYGPTFYNRLCYRSFCDTLDLLFNTIMPG